MSATSKPQQSMDLAQFEGHTPGPWITNKRSEVIAAADFRTVANCVHAINGERDAAFIAAAPALLAECKRQREELAELREREDTWSLKVDAKREQIAALREALELAAHTATGGLDGDAAAACDDIQSQARAALKVSEGESL